MRLRSAPAAASMAASLAAFLGASLALAPLDTAFAQSAPSQEELLQRLEEAEQRIRILERKLENQTEAQTTAAAEAPQVRATGTRFSIGTPDGSSFVRLRGVLHVDGRHFEGDGTPATSNTWLIRRVRPVVEGTFANLFDFRFTPHFAQGRTVIQDAYITARLQPWAAVTVGKFKAPIGLERIQDEVTDPGRRRALYDRFVVSQRSARIDPWAERVAGRHTDEFTPLSRRMEFAPA